MQVSLSARWANALSPINIDYQCMKFTTGKREKSSSLIKWLPVITITLLPSAAMAQQFTPEQMLDVMTKSPSHRDVRVHDTSRSYTQKFKPNDFVEVDAPYLKGLLLRDLPVQKYKNP